MNKFKQEFGLLSSFFGQNFLPKRNMSETDHDMCATVLIRYCPLLTHGHISTKKGLTGSSGLNISVSD